MFDKALFHKLLENFHVVLHTYIPGNVHSVDMLTVGLCECACVCVCVSVCFPGYYFIV